MNNCIIPISDNKWDKATITLIDQAKYWIYIEIENGVISKQVFYQQKEEITTYVESIVVCDQSEEIESFIYEGMMVLITSTQRTIPEIIEAYLFKELDMLEL